MGIARAEILAIGDELVHGFSVDTNSGKIARELETLGFDVRAFTTVTDAPDALADAIQRACARADVVIATGGLGPTEDDRTRAIAAAIAGVELVYHEPSWQLIVDRFETRGLKLPERNKVQAYLPAGAEVLQNDWGTAPGFSMQIEGAWFAALPGVPREMLEMLHHRVLPRLRTRYEGIGSLQFHEFRVMGLSEADLGDRIAHTMTADANPQVGITAHFGLLTIRLAGRGADEAEARARCSAVADDIRPRVQDHLLYEGPGKLHERVGQRLIETGTTIALAESCTAGMMASELASVPGISEVFLAGYVTYSNGAKMRDLDVPAAVLEEHGAVSREVAEAMATGAATRAGTRMGVAITGIAGPGGGTADKPVGTVCFAIALDGAVESWRRKFPDLGREFLRERSMIEALGGILRRLS